MTEKPLLIRDLMTVGVPTCSPTTSLSTIVGMILDQGYETLVVIDTDGHAIGVVSQDEVVGAFSRAHGVDESNLRALTAEQIMRDGVPQTPPDIPIIAAAQFMQDLRVRALFLMHHAGGIEYPAAMISYRHILRYLAAKDHHELKDLGIKAERRSPVDIFVEKREAARKNRQE